MRAIFGSQRSARIPRVKEKSKPIPLFSRRNWLQPLLHCSVFILRRIMECPNQSYQFYNKKFIFMNPEEATKITEEIMHYYEKNGGEEYSGEKLSQLEHMVQAAQLAEEQGQDEEVILAAFLHDIGHLCEEG